MFLASSKALVLKGTRIVSLCYLLFPVQIQALESLINQACKKFVRNSATFNTFSTGCPTVVWMQNSYGNSLQHTLQVGRLFGRHTRSGLSVCPDDILKSDTREIIRVSSVKAVTEIAGKKSTIEQQFFILCSQKSPIKVFFTTTESR